MLMVCVLENDNESNQVAFTATASNCAIQSYLMNWLYMETINRIVRGLFIVTKNRLKISNN